MPHRIDWVQVDEGYHTTEIKNRTGKIRLAIIHSDKYGQDTGYTTIRSIVGVGLISVGIIGIPAAYFLLT